MSETGTLHKIDLAVQALHARGADGVTEAVRLAREALKELPPEANKQETARVHGVLGQALLAAKDESQAISHLEQGLDLVRADMPSTFRCGLRIVLAHACLATQRGDDATFQLERAQEEARRIGSFSHLTEAVLQLARIRRMTGRDREATELLRATEREAAGTPWEAVLAVERLKPRHFGDAVGKELIAWIRRFAEGSLPSHPEVEQVMGLLIANAAPKLPQVLQRLLLHDALSERLGSLVRARLLDATGQREAAIALLRKALAQADMDEARLDLSGMLLALLPGQAHEETQRLCEFMEPLLDGAFDRPYLRSDLAEGFRRCAKGDRRLLDKAWRHAERAARDLSGDPLAFVYNTRIRALIRQAQLNPGAAASTPEQCVLASWFEQPLHLPPAELARFRREVSGALLHPGPFTHPDARALAARLLAQASEAPDAGQLQARLEWISKVSEGLPAVHPVSPGSRGPWDEAPSWAIALAQGRRPPLISSVDEIIKDLSWLLQARPDRQADCLGWLFDGISHLPPDSPSFNLLHMLSALGPRHGIGAPLMAALEDALRKTPAFPLLRLRVQLLQQAQGRGARTALERAIGELLSAARTPLERVEARFYLGTDRLMTWSSLPPLQRPPELLEEARGVLLAAVEEAKTHRLPPPLQFALWVSAGNAFRQSGADLLPRALDFYGQAEALGAPNALEASKLWKVTADALVERDLPGDAARALELIEKALEVRKAGHLRAETLLTASHVERLQKERGEPVRLRRAIDRLEEALRCDDGTNRLGYAAELLECIALLLRHAPRDQGLLQRLDELGALDPELAERAERARKGQASRIPDEMAGFMAQVLAHPAGNVYFESTRPLIPLDEALRDMGMDPQDLPEAMRQQLESDSQPGDVTALRGLTQQLLEERRPDVRPGALTARFVLLAHLAEQERSLAAEALQAGDEAERLVRSLEAPAVRHFLLGELAQTWAPQDTDSHPVRDFIRAARLYQEILAQLDPAGFIALDTKQKLARATRFRTDGDPRTHLRDAEQLFESCIAGYDSRGNKEGAAHLRQSLAQLRSVLRHGGGEAAYEEGVQASRERIATVRTHGQQAEAQAALAVSLTQAGAEHMGPEGDKKLAEAHGLFETLQWSHLPRGMHFDVQNFQTICRAETAWRKGDHGSAIRLWKERLSGIERDAHPSRWSMTAHNLADMILRRGLGTSTVDPKLLREGLAVGEQALLLRPLEQGPQFHWETCDTLGRGCSWLLANLPRGSPEAGPLLEQGTRRLESALQAARRMGGREQLWRSAFQLLLLCDFIVDLDRMEETADLAWNALDEARPFLLLDEASGAQEASACIGVALLRGRKLAEAGGAPPSPGCRFVLRDASAASVLRWMTRGLGATQRRLAARTARPAGVPSETWMRWLEAVRGGNAGDLARSVEQVQATEPSFLRGAPNLDGTWEWLRTRPGSVAIAVVGHGREWQAALLRHQEAPEIIIAGLQTTPLELREETVAQSVDADGSGPAYRELLAWARDNIVVPLERMSAGHPSHILWIPSGPLRMLAPSDLWRTAPIALATNLALPAQPSAPRPRGTLVTVADPGPGALGELRAAVKLGEQLARHCSGDARLLMSRGSKFGRALRLTHSGLLDHPASPEEVLRNLMEVDVALFLGHGAVTDPLDARLILVDRKGACADLGLAQVGEEPRRVSGATIILLACDSGRVGGWLHRAAGLAGAFLACGARQVIAPLWAVRLGAAFEVGQAVLEALASGRELSEALHHIQTEKTLDRTRLDAGRPWSLKSFVNWVG
ncbi:CHAT domain-containing protein [Corallococcus sp. BB11-1]|uniref:CHAT domain-containing protein n=1 Tax=Corallococcus sp. BB11-1 TaxID=2996783 RepID=UPI002271A2B7|nr:CHAT domain-containing protein [Corallococcus sp. BB11-1]MCY1033246.1 CHAT domain-containing protein [Corallococcus sp. BB11-1]